MDGRDQYVGALLCVCQHLDLGVFEMRYMGLLPVDTLHARRRAL